LPTLAFPPEFTASIEKFEINRSLEVVWDRIKLIDQQITDTAPFKVV